MSERAVGHAGRSAGDASAPVRRLRVWDLPTRCFHWLLVAFVAHNWLVVGEEGLALTLHAWVGYAVLAALVFRVAWGFAGSTHSRFADFIRSPAEVRAYARRFARHDPPHYVGHNPLGGWMIVLLLIALAVMAVTGLFIGDRDGATVGALAHLVSGGTAHLAKELHESVWGVLQVLIVVHLGGVFTHWILTADNLVGAMWSGVKEMRGETVGVEGRLRPAWLALGFAVAAVAAVAVVVNL